MVHVLMLFDLRLHYRVSGCSAETSAWSTPRHAAAASL